MKKKFLLLLILIGLSFLPGRFGERGGALAQAGQWVSPTGHNDPDNCWSYENRAYDDNESSYAFTSGQCADNYLTLNRNAAVISCSRIRLKASAYFSGVHSDPTVLLDAYYDGNWHNFWSGVISKNVWVEKSLDDTHSVTEVRVRADTPYGSGVRLQIYEFDFWEVQIPTPTPTPTPTLTPTPTPAPVTKTMIAASGESGGGVVSAGTILAPDTAAARSQRLWVATPYHSDVDFPTYNELQDIYGFDDPDTTEINQLANINSPGIYKIIEDEYDILPPEGPCKQLGVSAVIFIDGSLRIHQNFSDKLEDPSIDDLLAARQECKTATGDPTYPVFIVKDNITIEATVNNIYGIFYAGGDIITEAAATPPDGRLYIFGSLLANGFDLRRTLQAGNQNYPVEEIIYMPQYFLNLGTSDLLGRPKVTWREK